MVSDKILNLNTIQKKVQWSPWVIPLLPQHRIQESSLSCVTRGTGPLQVNSKLFKGSVRHSLNVCPHLTFSPKCPQSDFYFPSLWRQQRSPNYQIQHLTTPIVKLSWVSRTHLFPYSFFYLFNFSFSIFSSLGHLFVPHNSTEFHPIPFI